MWDETTNKQGTKLKASKKAYEALCGIIQSKQLRIGKYHEIVKVVVPRLKVRNTKTRKYELKLNHPVIIKSSPVCCVADIPIQHLNYHSKRYGKIAIGFYRDSIVSAGFNPVMYSLEHSSLSNYIHDAYMAIEDTDPWSAQSSLDDLETSVTTVFDQNSIDADFEKYSLEQDLDIIEDGYDEAKKNYERILAFIKTFDSAEFDSIYCEREWRSTEAFNFEEKDIAMIVLPKDHKNRNYFDEFVRASSLPRSIPILCWEDLIDH